ncbi:MAG: hypothetical protein NUV97_01265 [archaeon]|nr:hypothetical protein [archaeon]MCR4323408.1 hypothetical protein [Nanoarchaeota archaeon]
MADERDVVVVSIDDYSWNILKKKNFFAFPKGSRKILKYFAFYTGGKITHYAKVKSFKEASKGEVGFGYWLYCFPDANPPFHLVLFERMIKLKNTIKKDNLGRGRGHVQGRIYTTLNKLLKAKTIKDLA